MKVYHYTSTRLRTSHPGNTVFQPGSDLKAVSFFDGRKKVIYGLLEPLPAKWVNTGYIESIAVHSGRMLLEINIDPEEDKAFVVDEKFNVDLNPSLDSEETYSKGHRAFLVSKVPLREYLQRENEFDYTLPAVIIEGDVPAGRVRISDFQLLLEAHLKLRREAGFAYLDAVKLLKRIRGLDRWREEYAATHPEFRDERFPFERFLAWAQRR